MKFYTVHIRPRDRAPFETPLFVKEGFHFWAFVLPPFWALYHRLWGTAIALFALQAVLMWTEKRGVFSSETTAIWGVGIQLFAGFLADEWLRRKYKRQGYITAEIIAETSEERAWLRFFDRYAASAKTVVQT